MKNNAKFSYFELIVLMVVIGTMAVNIGPKFIRAFDETKTSRLIEGLEQMRLRLDLYKAEHDGRLPPSGSFESFKAAMTSKTGRFGPYIRRIPVNPFNKLNTVRFDGEPAGSNQAGWRLDTGTGLFQADNSTNYAVLSLGPEMIEKMKNGARTIKRLKTN